MFGGLPPVLSSRRRVMRKPVQHNPGCTASSGGGVMELGGGGGWGGGLLLLRGRHSGRQRGCGTCCGARRIAEHGVCHACRQGGLREC